ncbi:MAG TPA: hypothetical protein VM618_03575 [Acidimicrobiia bacterium]|nr:hypothetical protein [Acidimicrobiia bacterium]
MKRMVRWLAISAGAALTVTLLPASPASGAGAAAGVFLGSASVTPLYYPTSDVCILGGSPTCPAKTGRWTFGGSGVGAGADSDETAVGTLSAGASGDLGASHTLNVGAYCGISGGKNGLGSASVTDAVGGHSVNASLSEVGWNTSAASLIVFDGEALDEDGDEGDLVGLVSAIPDPTAGSCRDGTAETFVVVGAAVIQTAAGDVLPLLHDAA